MTDGEDRLPSGTVTFLFTDVGGSTALWDESPQPMSAAMSRHDELIEQAVVACGGTLVRPRGEGDSRFAVFTRASDALSAAGRIQNAMRTEQWATSRPVRVRIAVHTGETEVRDGDYYGTAVNRCARVRAIAHPGQILTTQATIDVAKGHLPADVRILDLGMHRLRDLVDAEHVFQVDAAGSSTSFPPLVSLDAVPNNLPFQLTPLVGRAAEIESASRLLGSHRLVTVTGPGGTGKTRLALSVAADALDRYPDGVYLVELAAVTNPETVAQKIADVVDVQATRGETVEETLGKYLRARSVLLVVDNCEHVIDACAKTVDALLRVTERVSVLATSQEPLAIAGEGLLALRSLGSADAVALFAQHARSLNPAFTVDDTNRQAVAAVCERLDGIPLAIQLAAARTRTLSPAQILERLSDRFRLLTAGERNAPERHRTLAAAVDWSHDLLGPADQMLYRRLAVFRGGATVDAIEAVCTGGDGIEELDPYGVLDLVQRLVDRSLVYTVPTGSVLRYQMLETIQDHAHTKLAASGELAALCDAHQRWLRGHAEAGYEGARTSDAAWWVASLRAEAENFRAALSWGLSGGDPTLGLETAHFLRRYWISEGLVREGVDWTERLLSVAPDERSARRARVLASFAEGKGIIGKDAEQEISAALAMAREVGNTAAEGFVEFGYAGIVFDSRGPLDALAHYRAALPLLPPGDSLVKVVNNNIGACFIDLAQWDAAAQHVAPLLAAAREEGNSYLVGMFSDIYGMALAESGQPELGLRHTEEAVRLLRANGDARGLVGVLNAHSAALIRSSRIPEAARAVHEIFEFLTSAADPNLLIEALATSARIASEMHDPTLAVVLCQGVTSVSIKYEFRIAPRVQQLMDRILDTAREALGPDFDATVAVAAAKNLDQIFAEGMAAMETLSRSTI